jgi:hypothetical protein
MTTTSKPYNSFLDEPCITMVESMSGKRHVQGWFDHTICGRYCGDRYTWSFLYLTSLRHVGRMSRNAYANRMCKTCANVYKDVDIDA